MALHKGGGVKVIDWLTKAIHGSKKKIFSIIYMKHLYFLTSINIYYVKPKILISIFYFSLAQLAL
jgi:hypothetical protein